MYFDQIGNMHGNADGASDVGSNNGPMWGKFFDSLQQGDDDDARSATSGSHAPPSSSGALRTPSRPGQMRAESSYMNPTSPDIAPGDSASAVGADDASDVGGRKGGPVASEAAKSALVDDGTYVFKFKTPSGRTHRFQARNDMLDNLREIVTGKLTSDPFFTEDPAQKTTLLEDDLIVTTSVLPKPDPADFTLSYTDDDGDLIHMTSDGDVVDAVKVARAQKTDRVVLYLSGGKVWDDAIKAQNAPPPSAPPAAPAVIPTPASIPSAISPPKPPKGLPSLEEETEAPASIGSSSASPSAILTPSAAPASAPTSPSVEEKSQPEPSKEASLAPSAKVHVSPSALAAANSGVGAGDGSIAGIPKDLLLPASIGFLGVAVLAVFALTRGSK